MKQNINHQPLLLFIHIISWGIIFVFPLLFMNKQVNNTINWMEYLRHSMVPFSLFIVFYTNYLSLIPNYFFRQQIKRYIIINILLITAVSLGLHFWHELNFQALQPPLQHMPAGIDKCRPDKMGPGSWVFYTRDMFSMILTVGLCLAIKISFRWTETESARREAEQSMTEAELKNLKNQLNPHFLLNTLNNIYALIAFSPEKAQQAVLDLSKLLRYVLYDNNQTYVPLQKEAEFMHNYIELMKIRLSDNIKVNVDITTQNGTDTKIAPLLFITLIENAFKHGVSYSEPSFINIQLCEQENGTVKCHIENSYFPKSQHDKSGSGIGLESLQKRLDLLYPGRYSWTKELKDNIYISDLVINKE